MKDKVREMKQIKAVFMLMVGVLGFLGGGYAYLFLTLPPLRDVKNYNPPVVTQVFSADGKLIGEFYVQRRIVVPNEEIPRLLKQAFVAAEDADFYRHQGVSLTALMRALLKNVEAGKIVQGGSTITQQLVRSLLLDNREKSFSRKAKEMVLARMVEQHLTKDEILYLYLNEIYLGHGNYGIGAAADYYFGKSPKDLNLAEMALLAGLPRAPEVYSPYRNFELAKKRQAYVLRRMVEEGYISEREAKEAYVTPLRLKEHDLELVEASQYYVEHVRRYLLDRYGEKAVYREGLKVYTALDSRLQKAAVEALKEGLLALESRRGYGGPEKVLAPNEVQGFVRALAQENKQIKKGGVYIGVVLKETKEGFAVSLGNKEGLLPHNKVLLWRGKKGLSPGCVIRVMVTDIKDEKLLLELYQEPKVEGAIFAMELPTGYVRAMVGGWDYNRSQFNRALQARRQPGSAFKPIVYAAALSKGFNPSSVVMDVPVTFQSASGSWSPRNYDGKFYGPVTLRYALAHSLNCATVNLARELGISYLSQFAKKLGITSPLNPDLSTALGSSPVTLFELVRAYGVFASGGHLIEPVFVVKVLDRKGNVLEYNPPLPLEAELRKKGIEPQGKFAPQVLDEAIAYLITDMLESVIEEGTGIRARTLERPCAGKTGTTNDYTDAWFIGYTPQLVAGVWVGFDTPRSLGHGETGARAALPIWLRFMKEAVRDLPPEDFPLPERVVFVRVNPETGAPASPDEAGVFEPFLEGTEPTPSSPDAFQQPRGSDATSQDN